MNTIVLNTVTARPSRGGSYLRGMASAFNLRGRTHRDYSLFGVEGQADITAVQNDWEVVGEDLSTAFRIVAG